MVTRAWYQPRSHIAVSERRPPPRWAETSRYACSVPASYYILYMRRVPLNRGIESPAPVTGAHGHEFASDRRSNALYIYIGIIYNTLQLLLTLRYIRSRRRRCVCACVCIYLYIKIYITCYVLRQYTVV